MILAHSDAPGTQPFTRPASVASPICDNPSEGTGKAIEEIPESNCRVIPCAGVGQGRGQALSPSWLLTGFSASLGIELNFFHAESGNIYLSNYHSLMACNSGG
jgi:hypothetical protein